jgi:hypothetical protein
MSQPSSVCVSVPTKGNIHAGTVMWMVHAARQGVFVDVVLDFEPLEAARNHQVRRFMESDYSHLFLLDADCIPRPQTLERLLAWKLPIVAAPHRSQKDGQRLIMALEQEGDRYKPYLPPLGLQRVDAVGGSGLMIERKVFEAVPPPAFRCVYDDTTGKLKRTEDFYFCERARAAGFDIWADFALVQQHMREVPL